MQLVWTELVYSLGQKFIHLYTPSISLSISGKLK